MFIIFNIIAITSIWCLGIKIVTHEGMALESLGKYAKRKVEAGNRVWEPLLFCEWCLPSIHSIIGYAFAFSLGLVNSWRYLLAYPIVAAGSSFLTGMCWLLYNLLEANKRYMKNREQLSHWDISDRKSKYHNNLKRNNIQH